MGEPLPGKHIESAVAPTPTEMRRDLAPAVEHEHRGCVIGGGHAGRRRVSHMVGDVVKAFGAEAGQGGGQEAGDPAHVQGAQAFPAVVGDVPSGTAGRGRDRRSNATTSMSPGSSPAWSRHQRIASTGSSHAENGTGSLPCLRRLNRSSSAAASVSPSTTRAAAGSWKTALMPRIVAIRRARTTRWASVHPPARTRGRADEWPPAAHLGRTGYRGTGSPAGRRPRSPGGWEPGQSPPS